MANSFPAVLLLWKCSTICLSWPDAWKGPLSLYLNVVLDALLNSANNDPHAQHKTPFANSVGLCLFSAFVLVWIKSSPLNNASQHYPFYSEKTSCFNGIFMSSNFCKYIWVFWVSFGFYNWFLLSFNCCFSMEWAYVIVLIISPCHT